jgi:hypothetical protein
MLKYDKYITNSLIITKYINKTYQHKNKCLLLTGQVLKREIIEMQIEHTRLPLLSYSCMFQVEICSQQLEICKSVCMFFVLAIVVETN